MTAMHSIPQASAGNDGPLTRVRVLELGNLVAAPFATRILADFGAEVVKLEAPGKGDPLRQWGEMHGDTSYWWHLHSRNKKSVTLNLRSPAGQDLARRLAARSDLVIENFRPGQLAAWGLDFATMQSLNPKLVLVHISGYGQTGPYRDRPGFGAIAEAMSGLRHLSGEPGRPSVRVGVSIGDSIAGLYAAFAAITALRHAELTGTGQEVDVALTESVLSLMEGILVEYSGAGKVRQPMGSRLATVAPSNTYPCADGRWVVIGGNSEPIFRRLMTMIGRPELADNPDFRTNVERVAHADELDEIISAWTRQRPLAEVLARLDEHDVPAGPIYSAAEIVQDPQYREREAVVDVGVAELSRALTMQGILPKFSGTPGAIRWTGPTLGEHNEEILGGVLGLSKSELQALTEQGVI